MGSKCKEHPTESLTLFCESCNKCICTVCHENGSHSQITCSVKPIHSAYASNIASLSQLVDSQMNVKRQSITEQIEHINGLIAVTKEKRLSIEIETRRDFDGILQRLKDEQARKLSILYVDLSTFRNILTEMEQIIQWTKQSPNENQEQREIDFLSQYSSLHERASILSAKFIKKNYSQQQVIDYCNDFPQEIQCRKQMIGSYNELLNDHDVKNQFIDFMLAERTKLTKQIASQNENIAEIENATKQEMKHWMELTDKFVSSLDSFKLKCVHCGIPMHQQSVNSFCDLNVCENADDNVEQEFGAKGSGLHYFVPFH